MYRYYTIESANKKGADQTAWIWHKQVFSWLGSNNVEWKFHAFGLQFYFHNPLLGKYFHKIYWHITQEYLVRDKKQIPENLFAVKLSTVRKIQKKIVAKLS